MAIVLRPTPKETEIQDPNLMPHLTYAKLSAVELFGEVVTVTDPHQSAPDIDDTANSQVAVHVVVLDSSSLLGQRGVTNWNPSELSLSKLSLTLQCSRVQNEKRFPLQQHKKDKKKTKEKNKRKEKKNPQNCGCA